MNAIITIENSEAIGEPIALPDNVKSAAGKQALITAVMEIMGGYDPKDEEDRALFIEQDEWIIKDLLRKGICDLDEDVSLQIIKISG